jgi:predicted phosphodiesterase
MNTLVISDTHLGKYDKEKESFLKKLIEKYERIIINGDFWDNWGGSFEELVNSDYKELLSLLKSKETIYIYGNHDYRAESQKHLGEIFSDKQGINFDINIGGKDFHFEHGHRFFHEQKKVRFRNYYYLIDKVPLLGPLVYKLMNFSYNLFPAKVTKNKMATRRNDYVKSIKPREINYVMSHTHIPEVDERNKFFNTGCIMGKFFSYLLIDEQGNVRLVKKEV